MANKKIREKRREMRHRRNNRKIEKELEEDTQINDEQIVDDDLNQSDDVVVEKEYDNGMEYHSPVSWEEMDAFEKAAEQAEKVRNSSWKVSDLVSNILYSGMSPEEKGKAIADVGIGYSKRVKEITTEKMEKGITDDELTVLHSSLS